MQTFEATAENPNPTPIDPGIHIFIGGGVEFLGFVEAQGSVELDGKRVADLTEGALDDYALPTDGASHKLTVSAHGRSIFSIEMQVAPAAQPKITSLVGEDSFIVTSLGNQATWYGDTQIKNPRIGDQRIALSPSGAALTLSEQNHQLYFGQSKDEGSFAVEISNVPALVIQSLNAEGQVFIAACPIACPDQDRRLCLYHLATGRSAYPHWWSARPTCRNPGADRGCQ